jgi:hypothetical protein
MFEWWTVRRLAQQVRNGNTLERVEAIRKLAELKSERATELLAEVLAAGPAFETDELPFEAALALGRRGDQRALEPLVEELRLNRVYQQPLAVKALAKIDDPRVSDAFLGLLAEPNAYAAAKDVAAQALKERGVEPEAGEARTFYLLANHEIDAAAESPVPELVRIHDNALDTVYIEPNAVAALSKVRDTTAIPDLLDALGHFQGAVKQAAGAALQAMPVEALAKDRSALKRLWTALDYRTKPGREYYCGLEVDQARGEAAANLLLRVAEATPSPEMQKAAAKARRVLAAIVAERERHLAGAVAESSDSSERSDEPSEFVFRRLRCPLCQSPLADFTWSGSAGGGDTRFCDGCGEQVHYFVPVGAKGKLILSMHTLPVGRADPGKFEYRA